MNKHKYIKIKLFYLPHFTKEIEKVDHNLTFV